MNIQGLQASCCNSIAFTLPPSLTPIFPIRRANLRRRRRPLWTTTKTTQLAKAAQGGHTDCRCPPASSFSLSCLASTGTPQGQEHELEQLWGAPLDDGVVDSPPMSSMLPSSSGGAEVGHGDPRGTDQPLLSLQAQAQAGTLPVPPLAPPQQPLSLSSKSKKRPRVLVPPLQRALGVGWAAAAAASTERNGGDRGDDTYMEQMQASIEELFGMQGLGSGSWNKAGGVPAAVEREQRTLVREIKALGRRGRWADVLEVIARARYQGTELNAIIYGCAINAVGRCGRYREAVMLLEQMPEEDIEPDEYSYRAAIIACSAAKQWRLAVALFHNFQRATDGLHRGRAGEASSPSTATYNAVISACAGGSYHNEALRFFQEMAERGVLRDEASYSGTIDACARVGLWQRTLELLSEMQTKGLRPTVTSYNSALAACAREGRWEEAADLIDVMRGDACGREVDSSEDIVLVPGLLRLQDEKGNSAMPPSASPPLNPRKGDGVRSHTEAVAAAAAFTGSTEATAGAPPRTAFDDMQTALLARRFPPAPPPNVRSFNACIAACRRGGQFGLARLFFQEMMSRGLRPDVWTFKSAMLGRMRVHQTTRIEPHAVAAVTPQKRFAELRSSDGASPQPSKNNAKGTFWREGLALLEEVGGEGLGPDPPCINLVLSQCARAGRWEESRKLLQELRRASPPGNAYYPSISRYNAVLRSLRNAPARGRRATTTAAAAALQGQLSEKDLGAGGGARTSHDWVEIDGGGKQSGAEGWTKGHVSGFLADMRAAGVTPDIETYQCAIRCATDAAVMDIAAANAAAAAREGAESAVVWKSAEAFQGGGGSASKSVAGLEKQGGEE